MYHNTTSYLLWIFRSKADIFYLLADNLFCHIESFCYKLCNTYYKVCNMY